MADSWSRIRKVFDNLFTFYDFELNNLLCRIFENFFNSLSLCQMFSCSRGILESLKDEDLSFSVSWEGTCIIMSRRVVQRAEECENRVCRK